MGWIMDGTLGKSWHVVSSEVEIRTNTLSVSGFTGWQSWQGPLWATVPVAGSLWGTPHPVKLHWRPGADRAQHTHKIYLNQSHCRRPAFLRVWNASAIFLLAAAT